MRLFLLTALMAVDWGAPRRRALDFALALSSIGLGVMLEATMLIWGGVAGFALALVNPMARLQAWARPHRRSAPSSAPPPSPAAIQIAPRARDPQ